MMHKYLSAAAGALLSTAVFAGPGADLDDMLEEIRARLMAIEAALEEPILPEPEPEPDPDPDPEPPVDPPIEPEPDPPPPPLPPHVGWRCLSAACATVIAEYSCPKHDCNVGPDGRPVSQHTYDQLVHANDSIYLLGGSVYRRGNAGQSPSMFRFDLSSQRWITVNDARAGGKVVTRPNGSGHAIGDQIYLVNPNGHFILDIETEEWIEPSNLSGLNNKTAIQYLEAADIFVGIGYGRAIWAARDDFGISWQTMQNAPQTLVDSSNLGMLEYDGDLLVWDTGSRVDRYDPETQSWDVIMPEGDNPGQRLNNGTFGRFANVNGKIVLINGPSRNAFVLHADPWRWEEIPNTAMDSVKRAGVDDHPMYAEAAAPGSWTAIQTAESGGVVVGDSVYVMGGGHGDGAHNGLLALDTKTWAWERVLEPSCILQRGGTVTCVDGSRWGYAASTEPPVEPPPVDPKPEPTPTPTPEPQPPPVLEEGRTPVPWPLAALPVLGVHPGGSPEAFPSYVDETCGLAREQWTQYEVGPGKQYETTNRGVFNIDKRGLRAVVKIYYRPEPYEGFKFDDARCVEIIGIEGPNGERPIVEGINMTQAFRPDEGDRINEGGLIVRNLHITNEGHCIGSPNASRFVSIENNEISHCHSHAFQVGPSAKQMRVRVLYNIVHDGGGNHLFYIDRVYSLWAQGNIFYNSGGKNGHAFRSIAREFLIEDNIFSSVNLNGEREQRYDRDEGSLYLGQHPLDIYNCADGVVRNNTIIFYQQNLTPGAIGVRERAAQNSCDMWGKSPDGETWELVSSRSGAFRDPANWAVIGTDLAEHSVDSRYAFNIRYDNNVMYLLGPGAAGLGVGIAISTTYPVHRGATSDEAVEGPLSALIKQYPEFAPGGAEFTSLEGTCELLAQRTDDLELQWLLRHTQPWTRDTTCAVSSKGRVKLAAHPDLPAPDNWIERQFNHYGFGNQLYLCGESLGDCAAHPKPIHINLRAGEDWTWRPGTQYPRVIDETGNAVIYYDLKTVPADD